MKSYILVAALLAAKFHAQEDIIPPFDDPDPDQLEIDPADIPVPVPREIPDIKWPAEYEFKGSGTIENPVLSQNRIKVR